MGAMRAMSGAEELLERACGGERRALGRLLSVVERGGAPAEELEELVHARTSDSRTSDSRAIDSRSSDARSSDARSSDARSSDARASDARASDARSSDSRSSDSRASDARAVHSGTNSEAPIIGVTGAPGSGKSTLVGHVVKEMADAGGRPAVLAVDPSSPLTGGAILGDRIRMDGVAAGRAFIRSMATRGHAGGLAMAVPGALRLFEACGFAPLVVETVGVGQVEVDVTRTADTTVVMVAPGMGDAVQANKSGLLEVADVLVVNKADRPGADDVRRDLEHMLDLGHITGINQHWRPEIIMTTATTGDGALKVHQAIQAHRAHLAKTGRLQDRRRSRIRQEVADRMARLTEDAVTDCLESEPRELLAALQGTRTPASAAASMMERLLR